MEYINRFFKKNLDEGTSNGTALQYPDIRQYYLRSGTQPRSSVTSGLLDGTQRSVYTPSGGTASSAVHIPLGTRDSVHDPSGTQRPGSFQQPQIPGTSHLVSTYRQPSIFVENIVRQVPFRDIRVIESLELKWDKCIAHWCYVECNNSDDLVRAWRASVRQGPEDANNICYLPDFPKPATRILLHCPIVKKSTPSATCALSTDTICSNYIMTKFGFQKVP
jgi:hypothetical protein